MSKTKVLVIDDSALMRRLLTKILSSDPQLEVVGAAEDPFVARDMIKRLKPDVLTLDVEMPRMDGLTFLKNLMRLHPLPVIMISTLTEKGASITMQALNLGAVDFVSKPKADLNSQLDVYGDDIISKVKVAARVSVSSLVRTFNSSDSNVASKATINTKHLISATSAEKIIAIGSSTGGTEAIKEVLVRLKPDSPGIVIAQHIPPMFSRTFAERMHRCSPLVVKEAEDGQPILPGHAFIAPGGRHLVVKRSGARYLCSIHDEPPVNRHRPSVDVLFDSVAANAGPAAIGAILTGMGDDGARGLKRMKDAGAPTIAQDEETSVVWGMPGSAVKLNGVDKVLPIEHIATKITEWVKAAEEKDCVAAT